jgi:hypothetical protein
VRSTAHGWSNAHRTRIAIASKIKDGEVLARVTFVLPAAVPIGGRPLILETAVWEHRL